MATIKRIQIINFIILAVLALGCVLTQSRNFTLSLLAGGIVTIANFYFIRQIISKLLAPEVKKKKVLSLVLLYFVKFTVLAALVFMLIKYLKIDKLGFIFGFSILLIALFIEGIYSGFRKEVKEN